MISPDKRDAAYRIFVEAADYPLTQQPGFIARECADDADIYGEVIRLSQIGANNRPLLPISLVGDFTETLTGGDSQRSTFNLSPGDQVENFTLIEQIGRGGLGEVWLAKEELRSGNNATPGPSREVALKILPTSQLGHEVETQAEIRHPAILAIYSFGQCEAYAWIAMELIRNSNHINTLKEFLHNKPQIDNPGQFIAAAWMIRQAADALQHALDTAGIIHRDVKPSNIFLGASGSIRIGDFGAASRLTDMDTAADGGGYTLRYASPEQVSGELAGPESDVFSLGVTLYEMITRDHPFKGGDRHSIINSIRHEAPTRPRALQPMLPRPLEAICLKCIHKEPNGRYRTAGELADDLGCFLERRPITAQTPSRLQQLQLWCRRNPYRALSASIAIIAFLATAKLAFDLKSANVRLSKSNTTLQDLAQFQSRRLQSLDIPAMALDARHEIAQRAESLASSLKPRPPQTAPQLAVRDVLAEVDLTGVMAKLVLSHILTPSYHQIETSFEGRPAEQSLLLHDLAVTMHTLGMPNEALEVQQEALATRRREFGEHHELTLQSGVLGGTLLNAVGQYTKALEVEMRLLDTSREMFGDNGYPTNNLRLNIAVTKMRIGDFDGAQQLEEKVFAQWKEELGAEHLDTLRAMGALSTTLRNLGHLEEASSMDEYVLASLREQVGNDSPRTRVAMQELAETLRLQGKFKAAEELGNELLLLASESLGDEHPGTLEALNNLATIISMGGDAERAHPMFERVLDGFIGTLGKNHTSTITAMANLADNLSSQDLHDQALPLLQDALRALEETLGTRNPSTMIARANLAIAQKGAGNLMAAKQTQEQVFADISEEFGEGHGYTLIMKNNLAAILKHAGELDRSAQLLEEVVVARLRDFGPEHYETRTARVNLAAVHRELGQLERSRIALEEVLAVDRQESGEEGSSTLSTTAQLARTMMMQGQPQEAQDLQEMVLRIYIRDLGEDHIKTLRATVELAETWLSNGKPIEAVKSIGHVLQKMVQTRGEKHPDTVVTRISFALACEGVEDQETSRSAAHKALEDAKGVLSDKHPKIRRAAQLLERIGQ